MIKTLTITDQEKLSYLAEQIKSIVQHTRDGVTVSMIAAKYQIGEEIVTSQLYKKYTKTQSNLFESVSNQTSMKVPTLMQCVKLYETYPKKDPDVLAVELFKEHGAWRNVRLALYGGESTAVETTEKEAKCKNCPIHCGNGR